MSRGGRPWGLTREEGVGAPQAGCGDTGSHFPAPGQAPSDLDASAPQPPLPHPSGPEVILDTAHSLDPTPRQCMPHGGAGPSE